MVEWDIFVNRDAEMVEVCNKVEEQPRKRQDQSPRKRQDQSPRKRQPQQQKQRQAQQPQKHHEHQPQQKQEKQPQKDNQQGKSKDSKTLDQSNDHMFLYKSQELLAKGELFIKNSRFSRSRKFYAELRGCTIVAYKSSNYTEDYANKNIEGVVAALPVNNFKIEASSSEDSKPRIYLTPRRCSENPLIYIRVPDVEGALQAWTTALGRVKTHPMPTLNNLCIESVIGRGGGGKVFLTIWKGKSYALKVINKPQTFKYARSFRHVASERLLMEKAGDHPFLLQMEFAFQTDKSLYIMTPFCPGGDLASYIRHNGSRSIPCDSGEYTGPPKKRYARLSEDQTRRISCEVMLGLEHLHSRGIVYRDLKPENIFIDGEGHVKIGDYGLSKLLLENKDGDGRVRTLSVCGTRNYLPPEMLHGQLYSFESDMWSFGVMIYRMLVGCFPFDAPRTKDVFNKIKMDSPKIPKWLSADVRQVLKGLLQKDANQRVGIGQLKRMSFFKDVNWDKVYKKRKTCIADVCVGAKAVDALENFELSKLYGITLGELVGPTGDEPELGVAYHKKDPRSTLIGFEYIRKCEGEKEVALEVKVTSGNFLRKLASIDVVSPLVSPRKNRDRKE